MCIYICIYKGESLVVVEHLLLRYARERSFLTSSSLSSLAAASSGLYIYIYTHTPLYPFRDFTDAARFDLSCFIFRILFYLYLFVHQSVILVEFTSRGLSVNNDCFQAVYIGT